jgi:hypothetical protein
MATNGVNLHQMPAKGVVLAHLSMHQHLTAPEHLTSGIAILRQLRIESWWTSGVIPVSSGWFMTGWAAPRET